MANISKNKIFTIMSIPLIIIFLYFCFPSFLKVVLLFLLLLIITIIIAIIYIYFQFKQPNIPWTDEDGLKYENIQYSQENTILNSYDIYIPKNSDNKKNLSLILYIHGGAWIAGDKKEHTADCRKLAKKGYVTATMNYSLINKKKFNEKNPPSISKMLTEIKMCISHILQFTNKKNFNINQMSLCGTSAGGHLAMLFVYSQKNFEIPIRFISIKVGPVDFNILFQTDKNKLEKLEKNIKNGKLNEDDIKEKNNIDEFILSCTGKKYENGNYNKNEIEEILSNYSPLKYVDENSILPAILAYGDKDGIVKPLHYEKLMEKYKELNGKFELIIFPNSGHTLWHDPDKTKKYEDTLVQWCKEYFGY